MSNHTPGPWIRKPDGQGTYSVVTNRVEMWLDAIDVGLEEHQVAIAGTVMSYTPAMNPVAFGPIGLDDARLIAAAPDLLAACEYAAQTIAAGAPNDDSAIAAHFFEAHDRLRAAIEMANGT